MLNISENSINQYLKLNEFTAYRLIKKRRYRTINYVVLIGILILSLLFLFLPWTQNIQTKGYVTTRSPQERPQAIQSIISGRLEKWYVQEGDFVQAGDTIVFLSEVKSEYLDPELVQRTAEQVDAKTQSGVSYDQKVSALENQYNALVDGLRLKRQQIQNKIQQAQNKIQIENAELDAAIKNLEIAQNQVERTRALYQKGLKTLSDLQEKELKLQQTQAKVTAQQNKVFNQQNELGNLQIEYSAVEREYADKMAKSQSDKQSALSAKLENVANTAKLKNQLSNYEARQNMYYVTAPQAGYITKTYKKGIGEIIKEGTDIVTIMPQNYNLAVEVYLKPQDLPLVNLGQEVALRFDGWPTLVISGWPESSTGIFYGNVVAIDQIISENGFYRTLISPKTENEKYWPKELRVGTGTQAFLMLNDVPIWYELWRQLNGFPADYYQAQKQNQEIKQKAPIKSVK